MAKALLSFGRWRRLIRKTNSFQIILVAILIHSLLSICIIYGYLVLYFSEEGSRVSSLDSRDGSLTASSGRKREGGIKWKHQSNGINIISNEVIQQDEITVRGWWMDHAKWKVDVQCFKQKWVFCSKVFSTACKTDRIRAIYQYLPFRKDSEVRHVDFQVKAMADQLSNQNNGAYFGLLALIKLSDNNLDYVKIQFSEEMVSFTSRTATYVAPKNTFIISITVMLMCFGYSGNVLFTDVSLIPRQGQLPISIASSEKLMSICSPMPSRSCCTKRKLREEELPVQGKAHSFSSHEVVTLVTQLSMDRLPTLEKSLQTWEGPVSLVIYIPFKNMDDDEYEWKKLYVEKKIKSLNITAGSRITLVYSSPSEKEYPINQLRNIAIRQVRSKYMLLVDTDFQPCPKFQQNFQSALKQLPPQSNSNKTAFVIPAFEYMEFPQKSDGIPQRKEELMQLLHRDDPYIQPFRVAESADAHRLTDYWKWYRQSSPYYVHTYSDKYEPYLVLRKTSLLPLYDEQFTGYGMNKVTHITELFASGFKFMVLPNVWITHLPHRISSYSIEFLQNPYQRLKNRMERFEFVNDVMRKYKLKECHSIN